MIAVDITPEEVSRRAAELDGAHWGDKGITCQSTRRRCKRPATVQMEIHLFRACNSPEANALGNRVELLCAECAAALRAFTAKFVDYMNRRAQALGTVTVCDTCGAPMAQVSDLIRGQGAI